MVVKSAEPIIMKKEGQDQFNIIEAATAAKKAGLRILSNKEVDALLNRGWEKADTIGAIWTGTLVIHGRPGEKLGKAVKTKSRDGLSWVFEVPPNFRSLKDAALVIEHPDYVLAEIGFRVTVRVPDLRKIRMVKDFPRQFGIYETDKEAGIPHGRALASNTETSRYFDRGSEPSIGVVERNSTTCVLPDEYERGVCLTTDTSMRFTVLAEKKK